MIELQYESKFDGFLVDLRVGPAEELNEAMFGGEPVFTYKRGATISSNVMPAETFGCLVWVERFDGSPESVATLFHELVHASTLRFEKSGVLRREPKPTDVRRGLVSFDELVANSVSELGTAFVAALASGEGFRRDGKAEPPEKKKDIDDKELFRGEEFFFPPLAD